MQGLKEDDRVFDCPEGALRCDVHLGGMREDSKRDCLREDLRFARALRRGGL
jgi:hypothetical protein